MLHLLLQVPQVYYTLLRLLPHGTGFLPCLQQRLQPGQKAADISSVVNERKEIIDQSLDNYGAVIVADDIDYAVDLANGLAPEHLELQVKEPMRYLGRVDNAGSVFMGKYSPEPLGDYFAGPNHVLPTGGTARFFSPLSVYSFTKRLSFIYYTEDALREAKDDIILMAEKEGLTAHANAIKVRFEGEETPQA